MSSIWQTLGIRRTHERAAIRRAYAARLKVTNPEDDADGFKVLRAAYEQALDYADGHAPAVGFARVDAQAFEAPQSAADRTDAEDVEANDVTGASEKHHPSQALEQAADPAAQERAAHWTARNTLAAMLERDATASDDSMRAALDAVVRSPAMMAIDVRDQTESWLAWILSVSSPRSDVLLGPAIRAFAWDSRMIGRALPPAVPQILKRQGSVGFLEELRRPDTAHHTAYKVLSAPPKPIGLSRRLLGNPSPHDIKALIDLMARSHNALMSDLNHETLAAWQAYFSRPRFSTWQLWTLIAAAPCFVLLAGMLLADPDLYPLSALPALPVIGAVMVLINFYLAQWPKYHWQQRAEAGQTSAWLELSWVPLTLAALVLASIPGLPWLTVGAMVIAIVASQWAAITGQADERPSSVPWLARGLLGYLCLLAWLVALLFSESGWSRYFPLVATCMTAVLTFIRGKVSLYQLWVQRTRLQQSLAIWATVVLCLGGFAVDVVYASSQADLVKTVVTTVTAITLVCRAPRLDTEGFSWRILWFGLILLVNHSLLSDIPLAFIGAVAVLVWNLFSLARTWEERRPAKS